MQNTSSTQQTSRPPAVFEPAIAGVERPQGYTLDRTATGIGGENHTKYDKSTLKSNVAFFNIGLANVHSDRFSLNVYTLTTSFLRNLLFMC